MTHNDAGHGDAASDEDRARAIRDQLKGVHAFDLAYEMAISLVSFGYQKMGLTEETRELRDLADARLAIELLRANLEVLEHERGETQTRDLRSTLAQMQLGYVRAVQVSGQAPEQPPQAAEPEPGRAAAREEHPPASAAPKEPPAAKPAAEKPASKRARKPTAKKQAPKKAAAKPAAKKPAAGKPRGGATPPAG
jgi:hypothetical protein